MAEDSDEEIIKEGKERFTRCEGWEASWRSNALFDTKFNNGDSLNLYQWDANVRTDRGARPCLTYNQCRQHVLQIVNDARQNKAQIKCSPTGGRASYEAAQVFAGIIRRIEYQSRAIDAYSTASYHQVESGIGYVRIETDYVGPDSFDLDLFIRRIPDPRSVYMDPDCKTYDKSDAAFAFIFEDIPRDRYEAEFGSSPEAPTSAALDHTGGWNDKDHVRVAEYWRKSMTTSKIHQLRDGLVIPDNEIPKDLRADIMQLVVKSREVQVPSIQWFKITGDKIIDREDWPGIYIPIVPWIGEETVIEGQMDRKGHVRAMIDAQRIYNYWASSAVEQVALQTKTPYVARADAVEGREEQWASANIKNYSVLVHNALDEQGNPIPPPQRNDPPVMAQAYIQGMTIARQDLMAVSGQYQAELGAPGNERSGTAIQQRQRQGDNATYHYIDNAAKAIRQVGRILIDMIPRVYDTRRVVMTLGEDGSESKVIIAPNAPEAHQQIVPGPDGQPVPITQGQADQHEENPDLPDPTIIFNPSIGQYSVEADVGPAYGTQRQEAANAFSQIMQQNPAAFQIVGDFWAQNSDFPGADELAERLKRGIPPQYKAGPDPQVAAIAQQAREQGDHAKQLLQQADAEIASLKAQLVHQTEQAKDKSQELETDVYRAETDRLKVVGGIDPAALQIVVRGLLRDMLQTDIVPALHAHAALEGQLQTALNPMPPQTGTNGAASPVPAEASP